MTTLTPQQVTSRNLARVEVEQKSAVAPAFLFPARPMNGGSLEVARPKRGTWLYEPKLNGWRTLIHAPTRTMWNRHGALLSIAKEFDDALGKLAALGEATGIEYFDCEGLERRHQLGHGCLYILDWIPTTLIARGCTWLHRSNVLDRHLARDCYDTLPVRHSLNRPDLLTPNAANWKAMQDINRVWSAEFYEGFVAKRIDRPYPRSTSATQETPDWVKHRWAF